MVPWPAIESRPAQTIRRGPKDGPAPRNRTRRPPGGPQRLWPRRNRRPRSHLMARAPPWCFCQETMPSPERATQGVGKRGQIAAANSGVRTVETVKRACYYCHQRTSRSATKGLAVRRAARRTVRRKAPLSSCARETSRPRRATKDKHQLSRGKWPPISQHSFSSYIVTSVPFSVCPLTRCLSEQTTWARASPHWMSRGTVFGHVAMGNKTKGRLMILAQAQAQYYCQTLITASETRRLSAQGIRYPRALFCRRD